MFFLPTFMIDLMVCWISRDLFTIDAICSFDLKLWKWVISAVDIFALAKNKCDLFGLGEKTQLCNGQSSSNSIKIIMRSAWRCVENRQQKSWNVKSVNGKIKTQKTGLFAQVNVEPSLAENKNSRVQQIDINVHAMKIKLQAKLCKKWKAS